MMIGGGDSHDYDDYNDDYNDDDDAEEEEEECALLVFSGRFEYHYDDYHCYK